MSIHISLSIVLAISFLLGGDIYLFKNLTIQ